MQIKIYNASDAKSYTISAGLSHEKGKVWIQNEAGEGGDFSVLLLNDVLFKATDDFFKENF